MNKIIKIITLNTINQNIEVILQYNNYVKDVIIINSPHSHSELLVLNIEQILKNNDINYKDLDFISIVNGPGSFIGLKTSISAVKAMQCILQKPIISSNLFEILSYNNSFDYIILLGDLNSYYLCDKNYNYHFVKQSEIENYIDKNSKIITNNINIKEKLNNYNIELVHYNNENLIKLNYDKYLKKEYSDNVEALYIKPPQVSLKKQ